MHRHQRHLRLAERSAPDHPTGDALQARIQRGPQRLARITDVAELPRLRQSPVGEVGPGRQVVGRAHVELRRRDRPRLRRRHVTGGHFRPQHRAHPPARQIEVLGRVVARRRLQQPGQHRRLPRREVLRLAVEVMQRGGAQTVSVVPEIGVRQVALENLVLGQPGFEPEGDQRFARLTAKRLLRREERELGELLGDRAATLGASAGQIAPRGPGNPARVDAPVVIETPVLDGDERVHHVRRQLRHPNRLVHDSPGARDRRAICGEQRDLGRRDRLERFGERRGDRQPQHEENEQAEESGDTAADPPPAAALLPEMPPRTGRFRLPGLARFIRAEKPVDLREPRRPGIARRILQRVERRLDFVRAVTAVLLA